MADRAPVSAALARHFLEAEGEQIVRDMAGRLGDQLFETMRRNGMLMGSVAGAVGVLTLAAAHTLAQAHDFLARSLADESDSEPGIVAGSEEALAVATLFVGELPESLQAGLRAAFLARVAEVVAEAEGDCCWRTCSGCAEGVDGQLSSTDYPHDPAFGCQRGGGCDDCGGIGATWDTTDYGALADEMLDADEAGGLRRG